MKEMEDCNRNNENEKNSKEIKSKNYTNDENFNQISSPNQIIVNNTRENRKCLTLIETMITIIRKTMTDNLKMSLLAPITSMDSMIEDIRTSCPSTSWSTPARGRWRSPPPTWTWRRRTP